MSIERLASLEARVERMQLKQDAQDRRLAALAQDAWQRAGNGSQGGSGGNLKQIRIDSGLTAGTMAAPTDNVAYLLKPDGSDGDEINLKNRYPDALSGSLYGWASLDGSDYYFVVGACTPE